MKEQNSKRFLISAFILVIVHVSGIIGMQTAYRELFLSLTPLNLLLCAGLLLYNHKEFNRQFLLFVFTVFLLGYLIEVAGVWSGLIFGHYLYDTSLGWKIVNVPLVIGVNWFMLIYCAGVISHRVRAHIFLKSIVGALLLVAIDLVIEQIAHRYAFWSWMEGIIPLQNYIAWFLVSFFFLMLFHALKFNKENKLAPVLYIIQLLFFIMLFAL